jgi:hypothetical protein
VIIDKLGIVAQKLIGLECKIFEDTKKESMLIINQGAGSIHTLTAQLSVVSNHLSRNHADATLSDLMKVPHS